MSPRSTGSAMRQSALPAAERLLWLHARHECPAPEHPVTRECNLDVSHLEPPEPMEKILASISALQSGQYLRVLIHRDPIPLYPILEREGFVRVTRLGEQSEFEILIWRFGDEAASSAAMSAS